MLPELEPGMPLAMQAAHPTAGTLMAQLVVEGIEVELPGREEHWLSQYTCVGCFFHLGYVLAVGCLACRRRIAPVPTGYTILNPM